MQHHKLFFIGLLCTICNNTEAMRRIWHNNQEIDAIVNVVQVLHNKIKNQNKMLYWLEKQRRILEQKLQDQRASYNELQSKYLALNNVYKALQEKCELLKKINQPKLLVSATNQKSRNAAVKSDVQQAKSFVSLLNINEKKNVTTKNKLNKKTLIVQLLNPSDTTGRIKKYIETKQRLNMQ